MIADFDREISSASGEIDALAKHDAHVDVLRQIRGIGRYTAMLVLAEVSDVSRLRSARTLCAETALTPTVRSSDGKGPIGAHNQGGVPRFGGHLRARRLVRYLLLFEISCS